MDKAVQGKATLRIALGGADGGGLAIGVNGKAVGTSGPSPPTPCGITRTGAYGMNTPSRSMRRC